MFILKALGSPRRSVVDLSHRVNQVTGCCGESGNSGPVRRLEAHKHTSWSREARFVAFIQLFLAVVTPR